MPSDRSTGSDCGLLARSRSSRAIASGPLATAVAHAPAPTTMATNPDARRRCIIRLLPIGIEHVFEAHPLRIEAEIDVPHTPVAILSHEKLRCALHVARAVVHPLPIQRDDDVGVMLHCAQGTEIVELWPTVRADTQQRKLCRRQYGDAGVERQRFQRTHRRRLFL